jgi:hypothetical protein
MRGYIDAPDGTRYYGEGKTSKDIYNEVNRQVLQMHDGKIPSSWLGKASTLVITDKQ